MAPTSKTKLVQHMAAGDLTALDAMAREYGPRLIAVARRCCRRHVDAEDAVQQAFEDATTSLTSFRGEGDPVAWLATIVARKCFRANKTRAREVLTATDLDTHEACACESADIQLENKRLGELLSLALMEIPRGDRLIFLLATDGCTGPEIADRFGTTPNAVRSRLKRTRKRLREILNDTLHPSARTTP